MTERKIKLIFGKRGSGKSYLAAHLLDQYLRYMVFDTLHEYRSGVIFDDKFLLARFWRERYQAQFRLIYRPTKPENEIAYISEMVWLCGDICFLVEEIDNYCTSHRLADSNLSNIIQRGRHKHITLIGVTQRPFGIPRILTSQAKEIYIFRTNEPRDIDYLKSLLGTEIELYLEKLQQYEFLKWEDGSEKITIAKIESGHISERSANKG
ncbi:MAG: hypothetical protein DRP65_04205 [Planctomycetota bacterium]|nr:MAG: hypothetical protein DRP65_04205 [Planctomycetota bacterium]